jgi:hypothetical protein
MKDFRVYKNELDETIIRHRRIQDTMASQFESTGTLVYQNVACWHRDRVNELLVERRYAKFMIEHVDDITRSSAA